jgi:mRNA-degrading endonuclease RelE of RelBE toxin-antitoxin system
VSKKEVRSISLRVRITPKLLRELKRLADQNRRTVSNYVCVVLEEHVERSERPPIKK